MFTINCKRYAFEKLLGHFLPESGPFPHQKQSVFQVKKPCFHAVWDSILLHITAVIRDNIHSVS